MERTLAEWVVLGAQVVAALAAGWAAFSAWRAARAAGRSVGLTEQRHQHDLQRLRMSALGDVYGLMAQLHRTSRGNAAAWSPATKRAITYLRRLVRARVLALDLPMPVATEFVHGNRFRRAVLVAAMHEVIATLRAEREMFFKPTE